MPIDRVNHAHSPVSLCLSIGWCKSESKLNNGHSEIFEFLNDFFFSDLIVAIGSV